ncbi:helix-turn-helix transcriptional regulator [Rhizobium hidalgonense]|uniref:helix-turn-helix transcriptional regulator n=1 Tax=Rhizobium hidalgonense TaxID=1538159 RepID=UPI0028726F04|nr:AlpA family phage regulatory protein [Rhizobium hidalgonense]MDR9813749.1 AlpA family phage regulatory protein [Rhizobium hidalgonense]
MENVLEQEARRIARLGFKAEIAELKNEVANLKANRPTGPPSFDAPALISLNDVCLLTSLSRTAVNRWRSLGLFPSAVPLGDKRVAFVKAEVERWIRARVSERDQAGSRKLR